MTDLINLNEFQNARPDGAFAALNPQDESLSDGIGSSFGVIHYKGKTWTLRKSGQDYTFKREDGSDEPFLDVVVLRSPNFLSKSYYREGFKEGVSAGKQPDCASVRGDRPDARVLNPVSPSCALCEFNAFGTAPGGGKGKACQDYRRLAVLIMPKQSKALLGTELMEPVALRIPPASLTDLAKLGEQMEARGFHYSSYVTRVGFQSGMAHPKMTFQAISKLTSAEAPVVLPMREDPVSYRITGERDFGKAQQLAPSVTQRIEQQAPVSAGAANQQRVPVGGAGPRTDNVITLNATKVEKVVEAVAAPYEDEITKLKRQLAEAQAKLDVTLQSALVEAAPVDTRPVSSAVSPTVVENAPAEESDPGLDDLVSTLFPR